MANPLSSLFPNRRYRVLLLLSFVLLISLGLLSKRYVGLGEDWVRHYSGDVLYEIFWCLFFFVLFPSRPAVWQIPLAVLAITCTLEFLQLWHPPVLVAWRQTFWGKTLLGSVFDWLDFPHYLLGCGLGWFWLRKLDQVKSESSKI